MKKIFFLITLLLLIPFDAKALVPNYSIDGVYINADIKDNGDMLVKEQIVMNGSFNGYIRDLYYKGNNSLYDASNIENISVCELPLKDRGIFLNDDIYTCFQKVSTASKGESHVYTLNNSFDYISLTMYNYNPSGTKIFYIVYILKDVVIIHNDIAELYWTFIGNGFDDNIADVEIEVNLPSTASDLRVWAHGPLTGDISKINNSKIKATIENLHANNLADIRAVFDKTLIPNGTKKANDVVFDAILHEEQQRADAANKEREDAKKILEEDQQKIESNTNKFNKISIIWILIATFITILLYFKYDKEREATFKLRYNREIPDGYSPEMIEYLMKKKVSTLSLSATILSIIEKKGLELKEVDSNSFFNKKDYLLIKGDSIEPLTTSEIYIKDWFINEIGDGTKVSLNKVKKYCKSDFGSFKFKEKYDYWTSLAEREGVKEGFYEKNVRTKVLLCFCYATGIYIYFKSLDTYSRTTIYTNFVFFISFALIIYTLKLTKKTVKGIEEYSKIKAFKNFLLDFGRFDEKELPVIVLWGKYMVYATALGISKKVSKAMNMKIKKLNIDASLNSSLYYNTNINHHFVRILTRGMSNAKMSAISKTTRYGILRSIARSGSSSGSGFGGMSSGHGGFSSGGGYGGGGTHGGGRGF
jgi:uncharacterized membrane protein